MIQKEENIIILFIIMFLGVFIYVWFFPLNKGDVVFYSGTDNYEIHTENNVIKCPSDPCKISFSSDYYSLVFKKKDYHSFEFNVNVRRWKEEEVRFIARKMISIEAIEGIPPNYKKSPTLPPPSHLKPENFVTYTLNNTGNKYLYLDKTDSKLKIYNDKKVKTLTTLSNIENDLSLTWSPNEENIVAQHNSDIYFIDAVNKSRKKHRLLFAPFNITWIKSENSFLFNDRYNKLFLIKWNNPTNVEDLGKTLDLSKIMWTQDNTFIYYEQSETETDFYLFNTEDKISEHLIKRYLFPISQMFYTSNNSTAYYKSSRDNKWYKLSL